MTAADRAVTAGAPPTGRRTGRWPVFVLLGLLAVGLALVAVALLGGGDDEPSQTLTTLPAVTAAPGTTATTTSPVRRYVGSERDVGEVPAGVTEVGGSFLEPDLGVAWVEGPEGPMLWLERVAAKSPDGSVTRWRVLDAVVLPGIVPGGTDVVVLGLTPCEIDGQAADAVVGVFPDVGEEWLGPARAAWRIDRATGTLVPITSTVRCTNEGFGV